MSLGECRVTVPGLCCGSEICAENCDPGFWRDSNGVVKRVGYSTSTDDGPVPCRRRRQGERRARSVDVIARVCQVITIGCIRCDVKLDIAHAGGWWCPIELEVAHRTGGTVLNKFQWRARGAN